MSLPFLPADKILSTYNQLLLGHSNISYEVLIPRIHGMIKLEGTLFSNWTITVASSKGDRISTKSLSMCSIHLDQL